MGSGVARDATVERTMYNLGESELVKRRDWKL